MSRMSQVSVGLAPWKSRRTITERSRRRSEPSARSARLAVSLTRKVSSGVSWCRPQDDSSSMTPTEENGRQRDSLRRWDRALLSTIDASQVLNRACPRKESIPTMAWSQASWMTSSASARLPAILDAGRRSALRSRENSSDCAERSRARSLSTSSWSSFPNRRFISSSRRSGGRVQHAPCQGDSRQWPSDRGDLRKALTQRSTQLHTERTSADTPFGFVRTTAGVRCAA